MEYFEAVDAETAATVVALQELVPCSYSSVVDMDVVALSNVLAGSLTSFDVLYQCVGQPRLLLSTHLGGLVHQWLPVCPHQAGTAEDDRLWIFGLPVALSDGLQHKSLLAWKHTQDHRIVDLLAASLMDTLQFLRLQLAVQLQHLDVLPQAILAEHMGALHFNFFALLGRGEADLAVGVFRRLHQ